MAGGAVLRTGSRAEKLVLLAWLCFSTLQGATLGAKVLVVPVDGSHWLSMKLLVKELIIRGHDVLILEPETPGTLARGVHGCRTELYPVSYTKETLDNVLKQLKDNLFLKLPKITDAVVNVQRLIDYTTTHVKGCEELLYNREVMGRLRLEGFDVVLTDPFLPCGSILAETLSVPIVYFLRGLPCGLDDIGTQCPSPPSFVPRFYSGHSDTMSFTQRVKNMLMYGVESASCHIMYARFDELVSRYLERELRYKELLSRGAVWLLRYDFAFLFPKPLMPNMVLIGGVNCAKASPLPADLEEFVDGSGDDGFVVFTLGSMVDKIPADMTTAFLDAFKKIPQRVVWRHTGITPEDVPENVKIMKWLPQNDLLAHPKAKLFLTHGGSHGIYEGICHGVPMVMMPLFGDQPDNVHYMVARGVAVVIDTFEVTTERVLEAINKVLTDTSYKEKMEDLMSVHLDQAVNPLDLAVFWTEFVIRHKGADHLRPAAHNLNWIQYHSLDTMGLLAAIVMAVAFLVVKCCCFCARKCGVRVAKKKKVL